MEILKFLIVAYLFCPQISVNIWNIGDFFIGDSSEFMDNEKIIQQFGNVIEYFWNRRAKEVKDFFNNYFPFKTKYLPKQDEFDNIKQRKSI